VVLDLESATQATWSIRGTKVSFIAYPFPLLWPLRGAHTLMPELAGLELAFETVKVFLRNEVECFLHTGGLGDSGGRCSP